MGTIWQLGLEFEARLLWEYRFPTDRPAIDVKFIFRVDLQILRCRIRGLPKFDPKVKVYEHAFPKTTDPEYQDWNIEEEFDRGVDIVIPEFVKELSQIPQADVGAIGAEWGAATEGKWHTRWPEHAPWALAQFIQLANLAIERKMCIFGTELY